MAEQWRRESDFLTTGEVASLLNISRSTVARKFDKGAFAGKTNPITGERMIERKSVTDFIERHGLDMPSSGSDTKKVAYVATNATVRKLIEAAFGHDSRLNVKSLASGCDALVYCSQNDVKILIIQEEMTDLPCSEVVKYVRKAADKDKLKIVCLRKEAHVATPSDWEATRVQLDKEIYPETISQEVLEEAVYGLLDMPKMPLMDDQKHAHQRGAVRCPIGISAKLRICTTGAPSGNGNDEEGIAVVDNISMSGVKLSNIKMSSGHVPGSAFHMRVVIDEEPLRDWQADCEVVRLQFVDSALMAGLRFTNISDADSHKVAHLVRTTAIA